MSFLLETGGIWRRLRVIAVMYTGVSIVCKRRAGQFLITERPYCVINGMETRPLAWDQSTFVPLVPNYPYQLSVQFPYMGKACGVATFTVTLRPGEAQLFEYKTPFVIFSQGSVKKKA
ncbi:MAG: hypothetical protein JSW28_05405 [Thermoplasmata archaeon]|nr:MAG: hypothetical protein JSW28_05405 [Thermoplasmata archaeon]